MCFSLPASFDFTTSLLDSSVCHRYSILISIAAVTDFGRASGSHVGAMIRRESGMWPERTNSCDWRSPQAFAGTHNDTRKLAQLDKKKPQLMTVGAAVLVEAGGIEPPSVSPLPLALHV